MFYALSDFFSPVSLRALAAFFTALLIALACGSRLIEFLHHHQSKGQPIREDGPQSHLPVSYTHLTLPTKLEV